MSDLDIIRKDLQERFGNHPFISLSQAACWLKRDPRTLLQYKDFPAKRRPGSTRWDVSVLDLAHWVNK